MRIALGCDHGGFPLKAKVAEVVKSCGHEIVDLGTDSSCSVDYPDYGLAGGLAIARREADRAILLCGSGIGISVAANKVPGVRAGVCHDTYSAHQGVEHDDMNVLCLGARIVGEALALEIVQSFLNAKYTHEERHARRLAKLLEIERRANSGEWTPAS